LNLAFGDVIFNNMAVEMPHPSINHAETFEHLAKAPITEAIIQIRGRAADPWEESPTVEKLKSALPDYPGCNSSRTIRHEFRFGEQTESGKTQDLGWEGVQFTSKDGRYVANFSRDAFSLSRLAPYDNWTAFSAEALRLYALHVGQARFPETERIGLRFVNQFDPLTEEFKLPDIFTQPVTVTPPDIPLQLALFFHQDTFAFPDSPYLVTVIRTLQLITLPDGRSVPKLILDLDIFTGQALSAKPDAIKDRLEDMRWIKNKLFFGSLSPLVLNSFR
jgi:hypothetical protein